MKINSTLPFAVISLLLFASVSCTKDKSVEKDLAWQGEIDLMIRQSMNAQDQLMVVSGDTSQGIYLENEGINPDFLVDETYLDENGHESQNGTDPDRIKVGQQSFLRCLKSLELNKTQATEVRSSLKRYKSCNENAVSKARVIYRELHIRYKEKYQRLYNASQTGSITQRKFEALVTELRANFIKELREMQLKEKLDGAFAACYRKFLQTLHPILSERQWNAFVECIKTQ